MFYVEGKFKGCKLSKSSLISPREYCTNYSVKISAQGWSICPQTTSGLQLALTLGNDLSLEELFSELHKCLFFAYDRYVAATHLANCRTCKTPSTLRGPEVERTAVTKDSSQESKQIAVLQELNRISSTVQNMTGVQLAGIWNRVVSFWLSTLSQGNQKINTVLAMVSDTIILTKYPCVGDLPVHYYHMVLGLSFLCF